jgi:deoxyribonuclease V
MTPAEAVALQQRLASSIKCGPPLDPASVRTIAGIDVSSTKEEPILTGGVVVCDARTLDVVETSAAQAEANFPYIPGLLSFRESPVLLKALEALQTEPDVVLVDGHGRSHPRRFGIACHIGLLIDRPTIGVAKSLLVGSDRDPGPNVGETIPLLDRGEEIGAIVRTREGASPIYVSIGHKIDLASAVQILLRATHDYRLPEPCRLAHLHVNSVRKGEQGIAVTRTTAPLQQTLL